jgi:hypothetical protein
MKVRYLSVMTQGKIIKAARAPFEYRAHPEFDDKIVSQPCGTIKPCRQHPFCCQALTLVDCHHIARYFLHFLAIIGKCVKIPATIQGQIQLTVIISIAGPEEKLKTAMSPQLFGSPWGSSKGEAISVKPWAGDVKLCQQTTTPSSHRPGNAQVGSEVVRMKRQ